MKADSASQMSLFDTTPPESGVASTVPVETDEQKAFRELLRMSERQLELYYRPLADVTDPDELVYVGSECPTRHGTKGQYPCCSFSMPVPLSWLDPEQIYCRHPAGGWSPKEPLPCWTCARRIVEFLIKLIR